MKTLKEIFKESKKEDIYNYYKRVSSKNIEYEKITREEMYYEICKSFKNNPELITKMSTIEEINILKEIINEEKIPKSINYLDYVLLDNLKSNYLISEEEGKYYIPKDILNYIKMAINIYNENEYINEDIACSVIIGIVKLHNVIPLKDFLEDLKFYNIVILEKDCLKYLKNNIRINKIIEVVRYKKETFIVSKENYYYKDILALNNKDLPSPNYTLEEIISYGKYELNLFKEPIFNYLNFLDKHLMPNYVKIFLEEIKIYAGFGLNDLEAIKKISGGIEELYLKTINVINYLPCWIYNGNSIKELEKLKKEILPNDICPCGSGKKYKHCCGKQS